MKLFANLPDGRPIHAVSIANDRLAATFLTHGARLLELRFDNSRSLVPPLHVEDLLASGKYTGVIVGPVMNRLAAARAPLDGETLVFTPNEGANLLHSGEDGVNTKIWELAETTETSVTFRLNLPPDSFPGNREINARYRLEESDFILEITATTDAPTLMNAGFHPYWNLSGGTPETHNVSIAAPHYLPMDSQNIPTGEIADASGTEFDYQVARTPTRDIDHCFVLQPRSKTEQAVRLASESIAMDVLTDAPAVHVYTGKDIGIAVEPEIHPDAPNQETFPSIRLAPGETFQQKVIHRFTNL